MLGRLAGRTHTVYTGIAVLDTRQPSHRLLDLVRSDVTMCALAQDEIAAYDATGEPLDKAGAYGIQGLGGRLVQHVAGSYTSVVGLPLPAVHRLLAASGIGPLVEPDEAFRHWITDRRLEVPPCSVP